MTQATLVHEALGTLLVSTIAVSVLVLAEVLKRTTNLPTELTRKFAHMCSGFAVLLIPVFLDHTWTVVVVTMGFATLMVTTHSMGLLKGVHDVGRGVGGVLWYPVTALGSYIVAFEIMDGTYLEYAIPMLVLACADAMGAVVGKRWGAHQYEVVPGHFRSLEGSAAFFVVALICISVPLIFGLDVEPLRALAVGAFVAVLATAHEAISVHGLDNLLVPLGTMLFLGLFLTKDWAGLGEHAVVLGGLISLGALVIRRRPATGGGVTAFVLAMYTVVVIGGWAWLPPTLGLVLTFYVYDRLSPQSGVLSASRYDMRTPALGLAVPVLFALVYGAVSDPRIQHGIYLGFIASVACQASVLCFLLPQHRSFVLPRLRRLVISKDAWQHQVTVGKVALAMVGLCIALAGPLLVTRPATALAATQPEVGLVTLACMIGVLTFLVLAATACARHTCAACGNIQLHGLGCCHKLGLGNGGPVSPRAMTFRRTYLASNLIAALSATMVVVAWTA